MPKPVIYILLVTAVICLLLGPVVILFLPLGDTIVRTGILMLIYGAIGLWVGMRQLEQQRQQVEGADAGRDERSFGPKG